MINNIKISNFKNIDEEFLNFKPLTILTGINSSGKSSVLQTIFLVSYYSKPNITLEKVISKIDNFKNIKNNRIRKGQSHIKLEVNGQSYSMSIEANKEWEVKTKVDLEFEKNLYYLSAGRIGQEDISQYNKNLKFGTDGEYIFGYFDKNKNIVVENLYNQGIDDTLAGQLKFWIKEVLDIDLEPFTQNVNDTNLSIQYKIEGFANPISPFNVGTGVSYAIKILIMGLCLKKGDIFIVESPEIHLHPKAISNLMWFLAFLVKSGIQIIIETHSEHIINKTRYCIYKNYLDNKDVIVHYKKDDIAKFETIKFNQNGNIVDINGNLTKFPQGFFDANLKELMELM